VTGRKKRASEPAVSGSAPRISDAVGDRFPGFDVLDQAGAWDPVTAGVVLSRIGRLPDIRFFTPAEEATATALCDRLLGQDSEPKVAVVPQIDARLAELQTDGWHYADMPEDGQAWRSSLRFLDEDSQDLCARDFAQAAMEDQRAIIQAVQDLGSKEWHGLNASHVWSLWTRYACTAFYAHPSAWNEIGFPGPAYPRGYKNAGVDAREPYEVADAQPADDPVSRKEN
jgi:gluconate 2-dehydrogenase subunit 3-like protein